MGMYIHCPDCVPTATKTDRAIQVLAAALIVIGVVVALLWAFGPDHFRKNMPDAPWAALLSCALGAQMIWRPPT